MEIKLSVVIITFNEEDNIGRCLDSVKNIADETIVVDSNSTDRTEEICAEYNVQFLRHTFEGHKEQKNFALNQATGEYILSLDADEALSPELQMIIKNLKDDFNKSGYRMNRLSWYQGSWIKHGGWYPDTKLRLVKRDVASWSGENPHDKLVLINKSNIGFLPGDIYHYSFKDLTDHTMRTNRYSTIAATEAFNRKARFSTFKLIFDPPFTFVKKYIFQLGFLDGYNGFLVARMAAFSNFLKYSKLKEVYSKSKELSRS